MNWESNVSEVSVDAVDEAFDVYLQARSEYEEASKKAKELNQVMLEHEWKLQEMLESAGKNSWQLDGKGKVSTYERVSYQTPKSVEEKKQLAKYMTDKMGKEAFWEMFSVNSQTLNSWAKLEIEQGAECIPGLKEPTVTKKLRLSRR